MQWKDIGDFVGKAAPILGNVLVGNIPGAAVAAGTMIAGALGVDATPEAVDGALKNDAEWQAKVRIVEDNNRTALEALALKLATAEVEKEISFQREVNTTMRVEAKAEGWGTRNWRPAVGFSFCFCALVSTIGLIVLGGNAIASKDPIMLTQVVALASALGTFFGITFMPVLGVSAWQRGKKQREEVAGGIQREAGPSLAQMARDKLMTIGR